MRPAENIEHLVKKLRYKAGAETRTRIYENVSRALEICQKQQSADLTPRIWRIIMKARITKLTAAVVIIIAVVLAITILDKSIPTAYALEQTIQANHSVRYLHIKNFITSHEDEPGQSWIEFDEEGQVKNVRLDVPEWAGGGDGAKLVVWKENKAQVWLKKKKAMVTVRDRSVANQFLKLVEQCDPKLSVQRLQTEAQQGNIEVQIEEPTNKSEPIIVTATGLKKDDDSPFQRIIFFVDQATRLVNSVELYKLTGSDFDLVMTLEYYDYNLPIDPEMFTLSDVPDDVMRIDQTTQKIGLLRGDLTGEEIAVEVARQFFEALIANEYARAGKLFEGIPATKIQEMYGNMNIIRIVSIGPAEPHPMPKVGGFRVPCKLEIEKDGIKSIWEPYGAGVRPQRNQPGRWGIHGGVSP